jgi:hypothetical protein
MGGHGNEMAANLVPGRAVTDRPETELEMVQRHVHDGEKRVARQMDMVAELERLHHEEAAALGRELLAVMRRTLDLAKHHLHDIQERPKR